MKYVTVISDFSHSQSMLSWWALREVRKEKNTYHLAAIRLPRASQRLSSKESTCHCRSCRRPGFDPCLGRSPGGGKCNPLEYYCQYIHIDRGAWWATIHGVTKSRTRLRDWTHTAATRQQPLPMVNTKGTQGVKTQDSGPTELRYISKEWFQWTQTLLTHKRALNSLTWDVLLLLFSC